MARLEIIFPDGSLITGETYREVEDQLRESQWRSYRTRRGFRSAMRARAKMWAGVEVARSFPESSRSFVRNLAAAGMFVLHENAD